jgi:hypothetical protein
MIFICMINWYNNEISRTGVFFHQINFKVENHWIGILLNVILVLQSVCRLFQNLYHFF